MQNNAELESVLQLLQSGEQANIKLARLYYQQVSGAKSEGEFIKRYYPLIFSQLVAPNFDSLITQWGTRIELKLWNSYTFEHAYPKACGGLKIYGKGGMKILGIENTSIKYISMRGFGKSKLPYIGENPLTEVKLLYILQTQVDADAIKSLPEMPNLDTIHIEKPVDADFDLSVFLRFPKLECLYLVPKIAFSIEQIEHFATSLKRAICFQASFKKGVLEQLKKSAITKYWSNINKK